MPKDTIICLHESYSAKKTPHITRKDGHRHTFKCVCAHTVADMHMLHVVHESGYTCLCRYDSNIHQMGDCFLSQCLYEMTQLL